MNWTLTGYKAKIGGLGLIFTGIGIAINCVITEDYTKMVEALELVGMGLAAIGIRFAQDRVAVKP